MFYRIIVPRWSQFNLCFRYFVSYYFLRVNEYLFFNLLTWNIDIAAMLQTVLVCLESIKVKNVGFISVESSLACRSL